VGFFDQLGAVLAIIAIALRHLFESCGRWSWTKTGVRSNRARFVLLDA